MNTENVLKMSQEGVAVKLAYTHDNGANPTFNILPIFNGSCETAVKVSREKLIEKTKAFSELRKALAKGSHWSYTNEDIRQIYDTWLELEKDGGINISPSMDFNELIASLFEVYKKENWDGELEDGDLLSGAYIRFKKGDTEPYFCLPWKKEHITDLLNTITEGWDREKLRTTAYIFCELWAGKDTNYHKYLYQNINAKTKEPWSLRIKMTPDLFNKDDIKKAKEIAKKGEKSNEQ